MSKILIVDDDSVNIALLEHALTKKCPGCEVFKAVNPLVGIKMASELMPDIILLDIMMPDLNGFEFCKRVKNNEKTKNIPVLLITALSDTSDKVAGFKLGAADYITKPINIEEVQARVLAHLRIKKYQDEILRMERVMHDNAKMAAVGSLAAGVAHEFNNILTMMRGYIQFYKKSSNLSDMQNACQTILTLINRGEGIVKTLLDFSRNNEYAGEKEDVDLAILIRNELHIMRKKLDEFGIKVEEGFCDELYTVKGYKGQISQALLNLLINAVDALSGVDGERVISVSIENVEGEFFYGGKLISGNFRAVVVEDSGPGIDEALKERVFEPFVTTKGVVGGGDNTRIAAGLGLSIVYTIMQRHMGYVSLEKSEKLGGAKFKLCFPKEELK